MVVSVWTKEMEDKLKEYWDEGLSTNQIGKLFGVTKNSIIGKAHRMNLTRRDPAVCKKRVAEENREARKQRKAKIANKIIKVEIESKPVEISIPVEVAEDNKHDFKHRDCELSHTEEVIFDKDDYHEDGLSLFELGHNMCHWPVGDPKKSGFHFCGHRTREGEVYCDFHKAMSIVHGSKK